MCAAQHVARLLLHCVDSKKTNPCVGLPFFRARVWSSFFNHPTRSISSGKNLKAQQPGDREELSEAKDVKMLLILLNAPWRK